MPNRSLAAFSAGVMLISFLPHLPGFLHLFILSAVLIAILLGLSFTKKVFSVKPLMAKEQLSQFNPKVWLFTLVLPLVVGMLWAVLWGQWHLARQLPESLNNQKVWLEGRVVQVDAQPDKPPKIQLEVRQINEQPSTHIQRVRLSWYEPGFIPEPGDQLQIKAKLQAIHGRLNPDGFDYHTWLFAHGVDAVGYVIADPVNQRIGDNQPDVFESLRARIGKLHDHFTTQADYRAITKALITGDSEDFSSAQWDLLRQTGTIHLVVISGSHIALFSLWLFYVLGWLIRLTGIGMPRYRADLWAALGAVFIAWAYTGLTGFNLPALRAMFMVWALLMSLILAYPLAYTTRFLLALALVLVIDPLAAYQPGFWLSFGIVAVILAYTKARVYPLKSDWLSKLKDFAVLQVLIFIGITPWLAWFFKQVSLIAPLVNMLAIPYVSFVLVPLDFCVSLFALVTQQVEGLHQLNLWLFQLLEYLTRLFVVILHGFRAVPFASLNLPGIDITFVWLLLIAVFCLFFRIRNLVYLALVCLLILFLPAQNVLQSGEFKLAVLDVGQSLSVLIQTQKHNFLYDVGPRFNSRSAVQQGDYEADSLLFAMMADDLVASAIIPNLRHYGVDRPDKVMISHDNQDHSGGLARLGLQGLVKSLDAPVGVLQKFFYLIPEKNLCQAGDAWVWDQVHFRVIHPPVLAPQLARRDHEANNNSCVIHISSAYGSVLLTGDIERSAEQQLVQRALVLPLQSQVLLVPHHGSKSSSSSNFIRTVNPAYAVVSAGYQNQFKHPHPQVLKLYRQQGIELKRTDQDGLVDFTFTSQGIKLWTQREKRAKYWFERRSG